MAKVMTSASFKEADSTIPAPLVPSRIKTKSHNYFTSIGYVVAALLIVVFSSVSATSVIAVAELVKQNGEANLQALDELVQQSVATIQTRIATSTADSTHSSRTERGRVSAQMAYPTALMSTSGYMWSGYAATKNYSDEPRQEYRSQSEHPTDSDSKGWLMLIAVMSGICVVVGTGLLAAE